MKVKGSAPFRRAAKVSILLALLTSAPALAAADGESTAQPSASEVAVLRGLLALQYPALAKSSEADAAAIRASADSGSRPASAVVASDSRPGF